MDMKLTESGLYVPSEYKKYPTMFSLFSGVGGFDLGFIQAGWEVVGALEWMPEAAHTYMVNLGAYPMAIHYTSNKQKERLEKYFDKYFKKHFKQKKQTVISMRNPGCQLESENIDLLPSTSGSAWIAAERTRGNYYPPVKNFWFGDIREITGKEILKTLDMKPGDLDCVTGGPPCQGFSKANPKSQKAYDPRNNMVFEFGRLVCELKPKTFIMENVPEIAQMRTPNGNLVLDELCRIFEDGDYMNYEAASKALGIVRKKGKRVDYIVTSERTKADKKQTQLDL